MQLRYIVISEEKIDDSFPVFQYKTTKLGQEETEMGIGEVRSKL